MPISTATPTASAVEATGIPFIPTPVLQTVAEPALVSFTVTTDDSAAGAAVSCSVVTSDSGASPQSLDNAVASAAVPVKVKAKAKAKLSKKDAEAREAYLLRCKRSYLPQSFDWSYGDGAGPLLSLGATLYDSMLPWMDASPYNKTLAKDGELTRVLQESKDRGENMRAVWKKILLPGRVEDPSIRAAAAFALGHKSLEHPSVTDTIVRMWFRARCRLMEEVRRREDKTMYGTGNRARRRKLTGDYLVRHEGRNGGYFPPAKRPDATAFTYPSSFYASTVRITGMDTREYQRTDDDGYPIGDRQTSVKAVRSIARDAEMTAINRDHRNDLAAMVAHPFFGNEHVGPGDLWWLLTRTTLTSREDFRHSLVPFLSRRDGKRTDQSKPLIPCDDLFPFLNKGWKMMRRAEHPSVLMPQAALYLTALRLAVAGREVTCPNPDLDERFSDILRSAARSCVPTSHTSLLSDPKGINCGILPGFGPLQPSGLGGLQNPREMVRRMLANPEADSGFTNAGELDVIDWNATFSQVSADDGRETVAPVPVRVSAKRVFELMGMAPDEAKKEFDAVLHAIRSGNNLSVVEFDPSMYPGLLRTIIDYDWANQVGVWATQSGGAGHDATVGATFNQQWAAQSCMRLYGAAAESFYAQRTDCRVALVVDTNGKVHGRALIWPSVKVYSRTSTTNGGYTESTTLDAPFMDRLYVTSPRAARTFAAYADEKGYYHRPSGGRTLFLRGVKQFRGKDITFGTPFFGVGCDGFSTVVPYLDTFRYAPRLQPNSMYLGMAFVGVYTADESLLSFEDLSSSGTRSVSNPRYPLDSGNEVGITSGSVESLDSFRAFTLPISSEDRGIPPADMQSARERGLIQAGASVESKPRYAMLWTGSEWERKVFRSPAEMSEAVRSENPLLAVRCPHFGNAYYIGPVEAFDTVESRNSLGGVEATYRLPKGILGRMEDDPWNPLSSRIHGKIAVRCHFHQAFSPPSVFNATYLSEPKWFDSDSNAIKERGEDPVKVRDLLKSLLPSS